MNIINFSSLKIKQKQILDNIQCYEDSPVYDAVIESYDEMEQEFRTLISVQAAWSYIPMINMNFLGKSDKAIATLYTLGNDISKRTTELFDNGDFLSGMILDTMSDYYLMEIDKEVSIFLGEMLKKQNIKTTRRFVPFEGISHEFQRIISNEIDLGITTTEGYMLDPVKSGCFIFGVGGEIKNESIFHDCARCGNVSCKFRDTDENGVVLGQKFFEL